MAIEVSNRRGLRQAPGMGTDTYPFGERALRRERRTYLPEKQTKVAPKLILKGLRYRHPSRSGPLASPTTWRDIKHQLRWLRTTFGSVRVLSDDEEDAYLASIQYPGLVSSPVPAMLDYGYILTPRVPKREPK
jgi:hypothetical protein